MLGLVATALACHPSPGMPSKTGSVKCSKGSSRFAVAMPGTDSCCLMKTLLTLSCASACACILEKEPRLFFEPANACKHTPSIHFCYEAFRKLPTSHQAITVGVTDSESLLWLLQTAGSIDQTTPYIQQWPHHLVAASVYPGSKTQHTRASSPQVFKSSTIAYRQSNCQIMQ